MVKTLKAALALGILSITALSTQAVSPALAWQQLTALDSPKEISVGTVSGFNTINPNILNLGSGKVLVTWVDEMLGENWLRARVIRADDSLSDQVTLNGSTAASNVGYQTSPTVAGNSKGKVFATWIEQTIEADHVVQTVKGVTSTDGITWSSPFVVIPAATFDTYTGTCDMDSDMNNCGYIHLTNAVDGQGNLAVIVAKRFDRSTTRIYVTATKDSSNWPRLHRIGTVNDLRDASVVGLTSGFVTNHMNYVGGSSCGVYLSIFSVADETWSSPITGSIRMANTVIHSQVIQRDAKTITLAMAAELEVGGLYFRNLNLTNKTWSSSSKEILPAKDRFVYQNLRVAKTGSGMAIGFVTYDQKIGRSYANLATQTSLNSAFKTSVLSNSGDQIDPLFISATTTGTPVYAYMGSGGPGLVAGSGLSKSLKLFHNLNYGGGGLIGADDYIYTVSADGDAGSYEVGVVKGKLN
jgi:hypothetical protein